MDGSKLTPASPLEWQTYYRDADERRRRAGWHRRGPSKPRRAFNQTRMVAIAMGLAAVAVLICLVLPN